MSDAMSREGAEKIASEMLSAYIREPEQRQFYTLAEIADVVLQLVTRIRVGDEPFFYRITTNKIEQDIIELECITTQDSASHKMMFALAKEQS